MELGEKIRFRRTEQNLTQQQLAERVFVTRQTISKWELNKSEPDPITLKLLEQTLQTELVEQKDFRSEKGEQISMKKIINLVYILLFGLFFLPFRITGTLIIKYWNKPIVKLVLVPLFMTIYLFYLYSLKVHVFYMFVVITIVFYLLTTLYFLSDSNKEI